jgi:hypothetical protein
MFSMKIKIVICLLLMNQFVFGQGVIRPTGFPTLTPIRGLSLSRSDLGTGLKYNDGSFLSEKAAGVKGTPFLFDDWKKGNVLLKTRERIDSVYIRYNLYSDLLGVKVDGEEYQFNIDVLEFLLPDSLTNTMNLFRSGFSPVAGLTERSFYQVLYDGKTKFLLKYKKEIASELTSTPGVKARVFEDHKLYYILTASGKMERIRKKNKTILDLFDDKREELKKMIDTNKLKLTTDEEIIKLLEFYDALSK